MTRRILGFAVRSTLFAAAAWLVGATPADAGWWHRWHGGSNGSYGSHGSSGGWVGHHGSWGSHGSSGGSYGSSGGSYGSSGGSYGSSGGGSSGGGYYYGGGSSGGSSGGYSAYYGGWGSSGGSSGGYSKGSYYETPAAPALPPAQAAPESSAKPAVPLQGEGGAVPPANPGDAGAALNSGSATLTVSVPSDAKIFVNGLPTRSIGEIRRYVSRGLSGAQTYTYEVRASVERNGETVEETKTVHLRSGEDMNVSFSLSNPVTVASNTSVETTLSVQVPEDATVTLAGNETTGAGALRVFKTQSLSAGETWENYKVVVTVERDGRTVSQEKTIALAGGETQSLSFDFENAKVADAR